MTLHKPSALLALLLAGCAASTAPDSTDSEGDGSGDALTTSTTKTALLANDTSASSLFVDAYAPATRFHGGAAPVSNGDAAPGSVDATTLAAGGVSKMSVHDLVSIPVFAETQSWFCTNGKSPLGTSASTDQCGSHIDIGYASNSSAEVKKQVGDMRARGIDGVLVDWDGQGAGLGVVDQATTSGPAINTGALTRYQHEAEASNGAFRFAIIEDEGIKGCASKAGCDVTQALISDIDFLATNFFGSPAYLQKNGRPVLFFFSLDAWVAKDGKSIDWSYVRAHVHGNPLFVFENSGGFTHDASDGAYSWLHTTPIGSYPGSDPFGVASFLPSFYGQAASHGSKIAWGGAWKGFDDGVVNGWGGGRRYAGQQCGKTFLDTLSAAEAHASRLDGVQIATWDDYEEGSEVETGIDNHASVRGTLTGTTLAIDVAAETAAPKDCTDAVAAGLDLRTTIDHFAVYASTDGENLELVADDVPATTRSLAVSGKIPTGASQLFVYAVGKAMIHNHLSAAIAISGGGGGSCGVPTILEPTIGESVGPAIRLRVSAPSCIEPMIAYVDGKKAVQVSGNAIDQWVSVTVGPHRLNVNGWAGTATAHVSKEIDFTRPN